MKLRIDILQQFSRLMMNVSCLIGNERSECPPVAKTYDRSLAKW